MNTGSITPSQMAIVRSLLDDQPQLRYQNPKLEIRKDVSHPFYFIRVRVPVVTAQGRITKRAVRVLGYVGEITIKEAMERRAAELETINAGRLIAHAQLTFRNVAERFLAVRVPQLGFATQKKYQTQIKNHLMPAFGKLRLCEIDGSAIEEWLREKEVAGLGWWSRIDLKGILSAIFTAAKGWKLWEGDNPTEGVRIGRKRLVREKRLLTVEELRMLLAALDDRPKFIVLIIFGLGLRISEVLGLRWSDVDFREKTITIKRRWYRGDLSEDGDTKSEASAATMRLGPSLMQEFEQRRPSTDGRGFVFVGDGGHLPPDDRDLLREEFRPVLKRLRIYYKGFGWHAFRRHSITWRQHVGGATPMEAQRAARHASLDMTLLYTLSDAERETAQQQKMFDKLMEGPVHEA